MTIDIFNPSMCFANELKGSWACNIITQSKNKIPIKVVGTEACLVLEHSGADQWFIGCLPVDKQWNGLDISTYSSLSFNLYSDTDRPCKCHVSFSDINDNESHRVLINPGVSHNGSDKVGLHSTNIPVKGFVNDKFDITHTKLVRFLGESNNAFYLSKITLT
jgi:hypothetical protein